MKPAADLALRKDVDVKLRRGGDSRPAQIAARRGRFAADAGGHTGRPTRLPSRPSPRWHDRRRPGLRLLLDRLTDRRPPSERGAWCRPRAPTKRDPARAVRVGARRRVVGSRRARRRTGDRCGGARDRGDQDLVADADLLRAVPALEALARVKAPSLTTRLYEACGARLRRSARRPRGWSSRRSQRGACPTGRPTSAATATPRTARGCRLRRGPTRRRSTRDAHARAGRSRVGCAHARRRVAARDGRDQRRAGSTAPLRHPAEFFESPRCCARVLAARIHRNASGRSRSN